MPDWTVHVRDFGRVAEASIEMAPLVVLVGRNNSGKSYIASLLWSLLNIDESWIGRLAKAPAWFDRFLARRDADEPIDRDALEQWLNEVLARIKDRVVRTLLSYEEAWIGDLRLTLAGDRTCRFVREPIDPDASENVLGRSVLRPRPTAVEMRYDVGGAADRELPDWITAKLIADAVDAAMFGHRGFSQARAIYVPAARTGLMLSLPFIVDDLLGALGLDQEDRGPTRLPQATIQFLRQVVNRSGKPRSDLAAIADFLERELLHGSVGRDDASPTFSYTPEAGAPLPLHTASSMVSELAPFLLLLRSSPLDRGLVFEEPESHLHLSAQRQLARAIARLINLGVPVVLTTHSDTFIQQLNILIALHGHPERDALMAEYSYAPEDLIDPANARGYEFLDDADGRTRVSSAPVVPTGFVISSLNEVLVELSEEAIATQDR